jgi:hypothetical protein
MRRYIHSLTTDEAGIEIVEWVAMGALMLTLIASIYGVMNHNGRLRAALTTLNAGYAANFGRDVVAQGPGMPASSGIISQQDGLLILDTADGSLQAVVDPVTGAYTLINTVTGEQTMVLPGPDTLVTVDTARGLVSLSRNNSRQTIVLRPLNQHATVIDHTTGSLASMNLADLQHIGAIEVRQRARFGAAPVIQPMLGVPALLAPGP